MPIDGIDPDGNVAAIKVGTRWQKGRIITADKPLQPGETPLRPHYATCASPDRVRVKTPAVKVPPQTESLF